jgi:XTP/dITP diphosphohydrolase
LYPKQGLDGKFRIVWQEKVERSVKGWYSGSQTKKGAWRLTESIKLLVATNNPGKIREYEALLEELPAGVEITLPAREGLDLEVEESGQTFEENARLKAEAYAAASGLPALADDSGLEVDALGRAPGVRSARYGGPGASDEDRYRKLLAALDGVPAGRRTARFRCVVALALPGGPVWTAEGRLEGQIGFTPRGEHGFGYDPVFVVAGYGGQTLAELEPGLKNRISHRARAVETALPGIEATLQRLQEGD